MFLEPCKMKLSDVKLDRVERSAKYVWQMSESKYVESVGFGCDEGFGICVSTQVGCGMGCTFCATARLGLFGNLTADQIFLQATATACRYSLDMGASSAPWLFATLAGMGEPLANIENTIQVLALLASAGIPIVSLSTIGLEEPLRRLANCEKDFRVYLSLHACSDKLRAQLIPASKSSSISTLIDILTRFAERRPLGQAQVSYLLLSGINDGEDHLESLIKLITTRPLVVQLLMWNEVHGLPYQRSSEEVATKWVRALRCAGVDVYLMPSAGRRIEGGCGQLAARSLNSPLSLRK